MRWLWDEARHTSYARTRMRFMFSCMRRGRKRFGGDASYFGEKGQEARVGLVRGEGADRGARNGAELFESGDDFLEARNRGAG